MRTLLHQPLFHFFALGAGLFVLYGFLNGDSGPAPDEIVVDENRITALAAGFERTWQRPPQPQELDRLIDNWVREEVLFREGLALGLDRGDPVVRRRIAQKIEFMADGGVRPPTEEELEEWLAQYSDRYRVPPRYSFEQRFYDPQRYGEQLEETLRSALAALRAGNAEGIPADVSLLPAGLELSTKAQIARSFGTAFASDLAQQPPGDWVGPIESSFGVHLVRVDNVEGGYLPDLDDVRVAVERDLMQARTDAVKVAFYQALRDRYTVRIEGNALRTPDVASN